MADELRERSKNMTENEKISRREALKKIGKWGAIGLGTASGLTGAAIAVDKLSNALVNLPEKPSTPTSTPIPEKTPTTAPSPTRLPDKTPTPIKEISSPIPDLSSKKEFTVNLGEEKRINLPLDWAPDTHTSLLKTKDEFWIFVSSAGTSYLVKTENFEQMGNPIKLLQPNNVEHKNGFIGYTGVSSVVNGLNEEEKLMFFHQETWKNKGNGSNYLAEVCLAVSKDNCQTWENKGPVLSGKNPANPGERVSGAGQPCAVVFNNEVYLFYTDWNARGADAIHLAKAPVNSLKSWQKFNGQDFEQPGKYDQSTAVISPEKTNLNLLYCALADISYNQYLNRWLALFESMDGFYTCSSTDLINWENYQKIFPFPRKRSEQKSGDTWYSYPTLLSLDTSSDQITNKSGVLVYSRGIIGGRHNMHYRPVRLI